MRIISKHRDYYDGVQFYGQDQKLIYLRKQEEIPTTDEFPRMNATSNDIKFIFLGVCGKIYPVLKVIDTEEYIYNIEEAHKIGRKLDSYYDTRSWWGFCKKNMEAFFFSTQLPDYFTKYKVPVFAVEFPCVGTMITLNPCLEDYNFQKVQDPYTLFQNIAGYISGVLGINAPNTIEISDKDQLHKKGFDNMSFKRMSPGKKEKRRNAKTK